MSAFFSGLNRFLLCFRWSRWSICCLLLTQETSQHWGGTQTSSVWFSLFRFSITKMTFAVDVLWWCSSQVQSFFHLLLLTYLLLVHSMKLCYLSAEPIFCVSHLFVQVCVVLYGHGTEGLRLPDGAARGSCWRWNSNAAITHVWNVSVCWWSWCCVLYVPGHAEVVRFLLEACKVNPVPKDR